MNFVISIFKILISFTTCVKLLMAYAIANEPIDNHLFFLFNFLLGSPCRLGNVHALVLEQSKLAKWGSFNMYIVLPKHKSLCLRATRHLRCLDILFITNIHNFNIRIHHMHTLIYNIRYVTYFGNIRKNVVKMFKPWLVRWRCTNCLNFLLFCFIDLCHFIPLVSNLLPIS
jgi:hypothetical protein